MQYVISAICCSVAWPFRKPIQSNYLFASSLVILITYGTYLFFHFDKTSLKWWALVPIPTEFREVLLAVLVINAISCYVFEKCFIGWYANKYEEK